MIVQLRYRFLGINGECKLIPLSSRHQTFVGSSVAVRGIPFASVSESLKAIMYSTADDVSMDAFLRERCSGPLRLPSFCDDNGFSSRAVTGS